MYNQAKLEKLKEIKRLMYELMADEGNGELSEDDLEEKLEEAEEAVGDEAPEVEVSEEEMVSESPESEEDEELMKPNYFQPKSPVKKPGTAVVFAKPQAMQPSLKDAIPLPKGKKSRFA